MQMKVEHTPINIDWLTFNWDMDDYRTVYC